MIYDKPININQINNNYKGRYKNKNVFILKVRLKYTVYMVYMFGLCYVIVLLVNITVGLTGGLKCLKK